MDIEKLKELSAEYQTKGLYRGSFESLCVSIHRQIQYANNVLLIEAERDIGEEVLLVYSMFEEAVRCLYWTKEHAKKCIESASLISFQVDEFRSLYSTHFRQNSIFNKICSDDIEQVIVLGEPAFDDWGGEFFIRTKSRNYVLMWDYCD